MVGPDEGLVPQVAHDPVRAEVRRGDAELEGQGGFLAFHRAFGGATGKGRVHLEGHRQLVEEHLRGELDAEAREVVVLEVGVQRPRPEVHAEARAAVLARVDLVVLGRDEQGTAAVKVA